MSLTRSAPRHDCSACSGRGQGETTVGVGAGVVDDVVGVGVAELFVGAGVGLVVVGAGFGAAAVVGDDAESPLGASVPGALLPAVNVCLPPYR